MYTCATAFVAAVRCAYVTHGVLSLFHQAPGAINFTMFLTLFGEKLNGTDPEDVIMNAFGCFDAKTLGTLRA